MGLKTNTWHHHHYYHYYYHYYHHHPTTIVVVVVAVKCYIKILGKSMRINLTLSGLVWSRCIMDGTWTAQTHLGSENQEATFAFRCNYLNCKYFYFVKVFDVDHKNKV